MTNYMDKIDLIIIELSTHFVFVSTCLLPVLYKQHTGPCQQNFAQAIFPCQYFLPSYFSSAEL